MLTNYLNVQIAGDSHGPAIYGVIENFPFGYAIDIEKINEDLRLRQIGYGRGARMKQEQDTVEVESGIWQGFTTNMPIVLRVRNRGSYPEGDDKRTVPRPGHADYAAYKKYGYDDMRLYAEGASARRTAGTVAVGSLCRQWLETLGIRILSFVVSCGNVECESTYDNVSSIGLRKLRNESAVFCPDTEATEKMISLIDEAKSAGDTLGGTIKTIVSGVDAGLGSFSSAQTRLDALLAANICSIPSVKGFYVGNQHVHQLFGSQAHDRIRRVGEEIIRPTNNAGGIEAGISNGMPVEFTSFFKPIPSLSRGMESVDLVSGEPSDVNYVRSDVTAIAPAAVVVEAVTAITIMDFVLAN
ncbi:MAG TPA: chorismate synthase [Thermotogota bacterium]|nr:chorismate synthase [Thermotogota bacterium]HPJ89566.1 chorismate synthase [Thermotogota bacterium]HPR95749.1 chorismate synthase [Thermotogota bacterium]